MATQKSRKSSAPGAAPAKAVNRGPDRVSAPAGGAEALDPPVVVHAYRRSPDLDGDGKERDVEVVAYGERVKFRSNERGHIVGTVATKSMLDRLIKEIPEAYIVYTGGENIPERKPEVGNRPQGEYVLVNGDQVKVLDDMSDEDLRAFAHEVGIEPEALPDVLTGDTLKRAIFNTLKTGE